MKRTDARLELRTDPRLLRSLRSLVSCYLDSFGFPENRCQEAVLAVDEACTNSIRHAYQGCGDRMMELTLLSDDLEVEIRVCDGGTPAKAEKIARRDLSAPDVSQLRPGGLGVQLMYEVFDEVVFEPGTEQGNCVILRLKRPERVDIPFDGDGTGTD
jgi:serine/threonine-protein kinase RsbW